MVKVTPGAEPAAAAETPPADVEPAAATETPPAVTTNNNEASAALNGIRVVTNKNGHAHRGASVLHADGVEKTHDDTETVALEHCSMAITVVGASGDLACKKTFPALFALFSRGLVPANMIVAGYARSTLTDAEYHAKVTKHFPKDADPAVVSAFLARCFYHAGAYDGADSWSGFNTELAKREHEVCADDKALRIFYFAIPPTLFVPVAKSVKAHAYSAFQNRLIVEKPFGADSDSSRALSEELAKLYDENEIFRIDHYLGKEVVQNLIVLRFANAFLEPLWNRHHIASVQITFKEPFGCKGRGGYFDKVGIIRDVMQNHLLQMLSLVGMEQPISLSAEDVRDEKTKFVRQIRPVTLADTVLGQYEGETTKDGEVGYTEDPTVPDDSVTPTFAMCVLNVDNERWRGVPFVLKCGKAMEQRKAEIRIQFKKPGNSLFEGHDDVAQNELVMRVQPNEAVYMKLLAKKPGLLGGIMNTALDLTYQERYALSAADMPDAYERLIHDVVRDDHNLFVRNDELTAAWKVFTPLLHAIEKEKIKPQKYGYGTRGPADADAMLASKGNYTRYDSPDEGFVWPTQPPRASTSTK